MNTVTSFYTKYIKRWVKSLGSAIGGALAGLLINWVQGTTPIPQTQKELVTLLIATVLPPILTLFAPTNKITQKQLDNDPHVIGGVVVSEEHRKALEDEVAKRDAPPTGGSHRKSSWQ